MKKHIRPLSLVSLTLLFLAGCAHASTQEIPENAVIWGVESQELIEPATLSMRVARAEQVVVGEIHSDDEAQRIEAWLLRKFIDGRPEEVTFAWEFLNWSERASVDAAYSAWGSGRLTEEEFLGQLFGKPGTYSTYLHPLRVAREYQLRLMPTNLTRDEKRPVVSGGIDSLDPALLPQGFQLGSEAYRERFIEAMGEHGEIPNIDHYFEAQSLTDEVIAEHLHRHRRTDRSMLVIGNFHAAYFDGVWRSLQRREPRIHRVLIYLEKRVEPMTHEEQKAFLKHEKYGPIADYVIFF